jgi:hypothetical protein
MTWLVVFVAGAAVGFADLEPGVASFARAWSAVNLASLGTCTWSLGLANNTGSR